MNAAARVVSGTKYDHGLTHLLHSELHWLDVADRVTYKLGVMVCKCLHGQAPDYLSELCTPVAQVAERQHIRFARRHLLVVPRFQLDTYGRRTFAVAGPTTWYLFQNNLREPDMQIDCQSHGLHGSAGTVLTAITLSYRKWRNSTPRRIKAPSLVDMKL